MSLLEISAAEAVAEMQRGSLSAQQYALGLLEQCERCESLNAFITIDREKVLEAASAADRLRRSGAALRPLHGLPLPVKDSVNTSELPTTAGTPSLRGFLPREDAPIVKILKDAGAIVLGKTNLHELSLGWTSNNQAFGAVRNPYDTRRIAGGSSGGTAAAVAARMAPLGVAEDTEGSIRVPAALCGITGFRPTTGRYPSGGTAPTSDLFDQVGPQARTIGDLALFDRVVTGDSQVILPKSLEGVRLGLARSYWFAHLDPEVERVTETAILKLREAGVEWVEREIADLADLIQHTTVTIQVHDILHTLPKYLKDSGAPVNLQEVIEQASPDVREFFARAGKGGSDFINEEVYDEACHTYLPRLRERFREYFTDTGVTAIMFPAVSIPAPMIGAEGDVAIGGEMVPFATAIARNIGPGSTAGLPGLVLPSGMTRCGLPVALEFDGASGTDRELLELGLSVEAVLGRVPAPRL